MVPRFVRYAIGKPVLALKRRSLTRFRRLLSDAKNAQAAHLAKCLRVTRGSAFQRDFGLVQDMTPETFAKAIDVAAYERVAPYIARVMQGEEAALFAPGTRILMFAVTSGTTAASKYIPVTASSLHEYRQSWTIWSCAVAEAYPALPFGGVVNLASSWQATVAPSGIPAGSITGLLLQMMHRTLRITNAVPPAVAEIRDAELRQYFALRFSLVRPDTMMITTANPSTLLAFARRLEESADSLLSDLAAGGSARIRELPLKFQKTFASALPANAQRAKDLAKMAGKAGGLKVAHVWPELALLGVWTGGSAGLYRPQLTQHYGPLPLRDHGLSASEGRFTIPLADNGPEGPLNLEGAYYEFIPESEKNASSPLILKAHELDVGERYYLVVTTTGGLIRYDLGDIVECTGYLEATPLLRFLHRGRDVSSLTGEKITAHQVSEALAKTQNSLDLSLGECSLIPVFGDPPRYCLLIEEGAQSSREAEIANFFERELCAQNLEYEDKRRSSRLGAVGVVWVKPDAFGEIKRARLALGAVAEQYKHPVLITDPALAGQLMREKAG